MDFNVIILATLCVVVLFQIIILINQQKNGKLVRDYFAQRAKNFQERGGERGDRFRDRNGNRPNRPPRAEQEFKPRTPQAPQAPAAAQGGAVDNVEKSLRDINLKLKNAERDQEVARRKFQDNTEIDGGARERDPSRRRHGRDGRDGRDGRGPRDENRDGRRGGGDRDRNRGNFRNRQDRPFQEERPAETTDAEMPETALPVEADNGAFSAPVAAAVPEMNASDYDSDNTEHGRKINVKRRMLKEDGLGENSSFSGEEPSSASGAGVDSPSETAPASDGEISFGRR